MNSTDTNAILKPLDTQNISGKSLLGTVLVIIILQALGVDINLKGLLIGEQDDDRLDDLELRIKVLEDREGE